MLPVVAPVLHPFSIGFESNAVYMMRPAVIKVYRTLTKRFNKGVILRPHTLRRGKRGSTAHSQQPSHFYGFTVHFKGVLLFVHTTVMYKGQGDAFTA